jgi:hypothetical protein
MDIDIDMDMDINIDKLSYLVMENPPFLVGF